MHHRTPCPLLLPQLHKRLNWGRPTDLYRQLLSPRLSVRKLSPLHPQAPPPAISDFRGRSPSETNGRPLKCVGVSCLERPVPIMQHIRSFSPLPWPSGSVLLSPARGLQRGDETDQVTEMECPRQHGQRSGPWTYPVIRTVISVD